MLTLPVLAWPDAVRGLAPVHATQRSFDGVDDTQIAGAAAQIPAELDANSATISIRKARDNVISSRQHPGRTESALQCVTLGEALPDRLHDRVAFIILDGANLAPVGGGGERDTRANRLAIHEKGARAADTVLAPDMRSRQQARIAQEIGKRCPGLDIHVHRRAIDRHLHARHAKISCSARNTLALRTLYSYLVRACLPHSAVRSASAADA